MKPTHPSFSLIPAIADRARTDCALEGGAPATPGSTRVPSFAGAPPSRSTQSFAAQFRVLTATALLLGSWAIGSSCAQAATTPAVTPLGAFANPLRGPSCAVADSTGRIYTTDPSNGQIAVLDAFGRQIEMRSGYARPIAIAIDSTGKIYLAEEGTGSVSILDSQWNVLSQLGSGKGEFSLPSHLALDPAQPNTVYVCDSRANAIKVYNNGSFSLAFGSGGTGNGQFAFPAGVYVSGAGEVFVIDQGNDRVEVFDRSGTYLRQFALKTSSGGMLSSGISGRAQGITGDSQGRLYIADSFQGLIKVFTTSGSFVATLGAYGEKAGMLRSPSEVAFDSLGRLLIPSVNNGRVELFGVDSFVHLSTIPTQPVIPAGTDVSFSAALTAAGPLTYQWYRDGFKLSDGANVNGATGPVLTVSSVASFDSGVYSVTVLGPDGSSFSSPGSKLRVLNLPKINGQPAVSSIPAGTGVVLSADVSGSELTYQWQLNGANIAGATARTLSLDSLAAGDSGHYTLVVSNALGSVSSEVANLTVQNTPARQPKLMGIASLAAEGAHLTLDCDAGYNYLIEGSDDLVNWSPLGTVVGDSAPIDYLDSDAINFSKRFYRTRWQP